MKKWFAWAYAILVILISGYLAVQVHQSEMEYGNSPQARIDLEEEIRAKVLERHGEDALYDYDNGEFIDLGTRNDVTMSYVFAPLMYGLFTFFFVGVVGGMLWGLGEWLVGRWRRFSVNNA